jgi:Spy/CpxP family protein refolding chaperone
MAALYFVLGIATALAAAAAYVSGLYFYLSYRKRSPIKGYLDLVTDLTPEQKEKVQEIRKTFLPKVNRIREDLCRERAQLADLLFHEPMDRSTLSALADRIIGHQAELEREVIEHILEEREILSAPQKRKFYEIIADQFASGGLGVHDVRGRK